MTFVSRLRQLDSDPDSSPYHRKTNNEGGPGGPLNIEKARDWEITWNKGRAVLLQRPVKTTQPKEDIPETTRDTTWNREGHNTGTLPSDPTGPMDKKEYADRDRKITEERIVMSYVDRLAMVLARSLTFQQVLGIIKKLFPEIKMRFPNPPTYVWNPQKEKSKEDQDNTDPEAGDDTEAQLEPQKIKDKIKTKLPDLQWDARMTDGIENTEMTFENGASALFEIGLKANHLTITYTAPEGEENEEDDNSDDNMNKNPDNPAFTGGE